MHTPCAGDVRTETAAVLGHVVAVVLGLGGGQPARPFTRVNRRGAVPVHALQAAAPYRSYAALRSPSSTLSTRSTRNTLGCGSTCATAAAAAATSCSTVRPTCHCSWGRVLGPYLEQGLGGARHLGNGNPRIRTTCAAAVAAEQGQGSAAVTMEAKVL
jgi:hypothetical protein